MDASSYVDQVAFPIEAQFVIFAKIDEHPCVARGREACERCQGRETSHRMKASAKGSDSVQPVAAPAPLATDGTWS